MRLALAAALACASLAGACADQVDALDGSVSEFYPLAFSAVRARLYSSELSIEFVTASGEAVVRVTVRRAEHEPKGAESIDLGTYGDVTGSSDGAEIPPFVGGNLSLSAYRPKDGARVAGRFDARLASGDVTLSVRGTFDAKLDVVEGLGDEPDAGVAP